MPKLLPDAALHVEFGVIAPHVAAVGERVYGTATHQVIRASRHWRPVQISGAPKRSRLYSAVLLAMTLIGSGCDTVNSVFGPGSAPQQGQPGFVQGFLGGVATDEPRATLAARQVLSAGGTAADAAVAAGFALSVTLPSRAGLGGGGACLAYAADKKSPNQGVPEAVLFTPIAPASVGANADRPAAVPMLARGLYLLHARYGSLPFEGLIVPSEQLARFGTPTPRALANDIALVAGPLLADPQARAVFSQNGTPLTEGQPLVQPDLGATLAQIRVSGVGDLYTGALARRIVQASPLAGGPIALADLNGALPRLAPALVVPYRRDRVAFLPPPADGGLAAASAFSLLAQDPSALGAANARALAVAARWRQGGADAESLLTLPPISPGGSLPALPASTSVVTLDKDGNAVACALQHGQSVRHRPRAARPRHPARCIACGDAAAAVCRGHCLERQHTRVPRSSRRLWPGGCADGSRGRDAQCTSHQSTDGYASPRSWPRQCHLLRQLPAR